MTDLPPHSIACALELVGAVRDHDPGKVAHTLRNAASLDGLEALAVTLAAMVDDERTLPELLAWTVGERPHGEAEVAAERFQVQAWRAQLTDKECRDYRNAYLSGNRDPEVVDGWREAQKRAARKSRAKDARSLRSVAS